MTKILSIAAFAALFVLGACERRDRMDSDNEAVGTYEIDKKNVGEGEFEKADKVEAAKPVGEGEKELGQAKNDSALTNEQIIQNFQTDLMSDPDIAAVANAYISVEDDGDLVLRGTAKSDDVSKELHDYAEELAGRAVNNEIKVLDD